MNKHGVSFFFILIPYLLSEKYITRRHIFHSLTKSVFFKTVFVVFTSQ